ncbi:serine--tRNA ligase [Parasphingorhabdus sp.]|uniref:serine--tRNA ligase n=1 Tax=Parasphingorhabdus sp. TaxID=2709688 RepID=UPI0030B149E9|nr:serine--tRNA ligase [Sphingomonadales bacterium]
MHDIKYIRENPEEFDASLARRGVEPVAIKILNADKVRRQLQSEIEQLNSQKKQLSAAFGQLAGQGQGNTVEAMEFKDRSIEVAKKLTDFIGKLAEAQEITPLLAGLPNLPDEDVPDGADENDNVEVERWGEPRKFDFEPKEHSDIGPALGLDFETAAAMSGARFAFLRGQMARLQRAIGQYMLDQQTMTNGFQECAPPVLVREQAMFGTGQLPKFSEDSFQTTDGRWLIPTAEVSLTNSVSGQILDEAQLPIRLTALTPCFRSEAGSAGKDTKGLIRQHQFEKVEMVAITHPDYSDTEHLRMTEAAESILKALELPYRKMLLCAGDMGATARKTYDLEVWLPGQNTYREISSISTCGDYQARRMNVRFRPEGEEKGTRFVHTLNGSGLAVGRTLVAVLENYQQADGSVTIPPVLLPYMGGIDKLEPS